MLDPDEVSMLRWCFFFTFACGVALGMAVGVVVMVPLITGVCQ